jgi:hypothetical protein
VHHEVSGSSSESDERLTPELSDEARRARDIDVVERVCDWHKEVQPNLRARSDEDSPTAASSPHEIETEGSCCGLVDRRHGLRAPKPDRRPIRIAEGREATCRLRGDDELAGS